MKINSIFKYSGFAMFLLLCATLITLSQVNNAKSKYQSGLNGASEASVAKWEVSVTPVTETNTFNIVAGNTLPIEYTVRVSSNSQVSNSYSIIVLNIPEGIKVSIDNGTEQTPTNNTVTFSNVGAFNIEDNTAYHDHKLTFSVPIETKEVENNNVKIQVSFTQKD